MRAWPAQRLLTSWRLLKAARYPRAAFFSNEQMFGAKQQAPHAGGHYKEAEETAFGLF
jgi:hypothetical protein